MEKIEKTEISDEHSNDQRLVEKAVQLSLIEVFIGSALHAFKIPFSGHVLSLNQGLLLLKFSENCPSRTLALRSMVEISLIASCMKALSPAGKKLGPMISISNQGGLLGLGIFIFGNNLLGQILGMMFLASWAFLQPIVSYLIIYGPDLIKAFGYLLKRITKYTGAGLDSVTYVLIGIVSLKLCLAAMIPFLLRYLNRKGWDRYETLVRKKAAGNILIKGFREPHKNAFKGALKDLLTPAFLISLIFMGSFFFISEVDHVHAMWKVLRSLAIAFLFFYLMRANWVQRILLAMAKRNQFFARIYRLADSSFQRMLKILGKSV